MTSTQFLVPAAAAVSFLAGTLTSAALSQGGGRAQPAPAVVSVAFMKVEPDRAGDYLRLEREIWMPIHRERIRRGQLRSWTLYEVQFPFGTETEYGFVTVNVHDSLADLERDLGDVFGRVHPTVPLDTLARRTYGARRLVRGEVWRRVEHLQ